MLNSSFNFVRTCFIRPLHTLASKTCPQNRYTHRVSILGLESSVDEGWSLGFAFKPLNLIRLNHKVKIFDIHVVAIQTILFIHLYSIPNRGKKELDVLLEV